MSDLLVGSGDDASDLIDLKVNKKFASSYNFNERARELIRSKDLLKDDNSSQGESDSESETEDDDAELLSAELDLKIIQTINSLRKKDPSIYDSGTRWFDATEVDNEAIPVHVHPKDAKKKRFKDIARDQLLSTEDFEKLNSSTSDPSSRAANALQRTGAIAYDEEQRQLRNAFLQSASSYLGIEEVETGDILKVKAAVAPAPPTSLELQAALQEMKQLGLRQCAGRDETGKTILLEHKSEADREEFLASYFSKALWKSDKQFEPRHVHEDNELGPLPDEDDDTEDGEEVEKMEKFESKYNFRFEELQELQKNSTKNDTEGGSYQVVGHARAIQGSLRRVDDKRKEERERRKEKKEKERRQQEAELRRLKNLKRQEMHDRLKKIAAISGLADAELGMLNEDFLDEDWDPTKYETLMEGQFGDEYYDENDDTFPAEADDETLINDDYLYEAVNDDVNYEDGSGYVNIANIEQNMGSSKASARFSKIRKEADEMSNELYELDYEDIVAGLPCRFKYRSVHPEDFGLSTEEILQADDNDLNKFVSLKKISAYGNQINDGIDLSKKRKRLRASIQEKRQLQIIEASIGQPSIGMTSDSTKAPSYDNSRVDEEPPKRKRKRRKGTNNLDEASAPQAMQNTEPANVFGEIRGALPEHRIPSEEKKRVKKSKRKTSGNLTNRMHLYR